MSVLKVILVWVALIPAGIAYADAPDPASAKPVTDLAVRFDQAFFDLDPADPAAHDSELVVSDIKIEFSEDGLHIRGIYHVRMFSIHLFDVDFHSILEPTWVDRNVFDVNVTKLDVAGFLELRSMSRVVLEAFEDRLDSALKGACKFEYLGEIAADAKTIRVTVDMKKLLPAFPDLNLVGVKVRRNVLILKAGR